MPVKVGSHVAKAGEVDFVRIKQFAQGGFNAEDNPHHLLLFILFQIGHFKFVSIQDDAAETGVVLIGNMSDAAECVFLDHFSAG